MELEDINIDEEAEPQPDGEARALNQAQENVEENNCQNDNRPTYFFDIFLKVCVINCN
jgi:hypothetical protein